MFFYSPFGTSTHCSGSTPEVGDREQYWTVPILNFRKGVIVSETRVEDGSKLMPVLVTTQHRGVFFGYADPSKIQERSFSLQRVRCCISWASSIGGFLGLSSKGPDSNCRIGTEAVEVLLHDITSVTQCTEAAVAAWTKA